MIKFFMLLPLAVFTFYDCKVRSCQQKIALNTKFYKKWVNCPLLAISIVNSLKNVKNRQKRIKTVKKPLKPLKTVRILKNPKNHQN